MPTPVPGSVAAEILDALAPMLYDDPGGDLATYLTSISNVLIQEIEDYVSDDPITGAIGYSQWVDISRIPDKVIPWLSQFMGVGASLGASPADQKFQLTDLPNFRRGSVTALRNAPAPFMSGNKTVVFRERFGGPWKLWIITRLDETPVDDWPTTNYCDNSSFLTNTTHWSGGITRDGSIIPPWDLWAGRVTSGGTATYLMPGTISGPVSGDKFTCSIWVYSAGADIGKTVGFDVENYLVGGGVTNFVLTGDWQQLIVTDTITTDHPRFQISVVAPASSDIRITSAQIEWRDHYTIFVETDGAIATDPETAGNGPVGDALRAQKPAGISMTYHVTNFQDLLTLKNNYATLQLVYDAYKTLNGVLLNAPGE